MKLEARRFEEMLEALKENSLGTVRGYQSPAELAKESYTSQDFEEIEEGEATYSLHLLKRDLRSDVEAALEDPEALLEAMKGFAEIGIGKSDGEVHWRKGEDWIVVRAKLLREEDLRGDEFVFVNLGVRGISSGWAALIWGPGKEAFAAVFGFDQWSEEGWEEGEVRFQGAGG